jgi:hypothetical protein
VPARRIRSRLTGPATTAAAREAGLSYWHLRHRDVVHLSRDTFLPRSLADDAAAHMAAVLLSAPERAVLSHASAALLWDLAVPLQPTDLRVHLTVLPGSAVRNRNDRCIHRTPYVEEDMTRRHGFPVTNPRRTWRDLAGVLPPAALLAVTDQLVARWCTPEDLRRQLSRRPGGRGSARARAVLPVANPLAESPMESVLRWLLHGAGLPEPVLQHSVHDAAGRFIGRADLAWPERRVLVEFDGDLHRNRAVFVNDLRRQNRLIAAGWTVLRFTSADVMGRPAEVIAEIRAALGA